MDARQYQLKRDELLKLMGQVVKVDGIRDSERESFLSTQRKLVENQFNIVLIGEFQGGKSTTFNAMCGGREISPRGAMTKTSAICMTATNISDPTQEEYAEVRWKSNSELRDMINEVIKFVILGDGESFDFNNSSHIRNLREQVEKMREESVIEVKEIVRIAQLLLAFYGNTELQNYYARNRFKIEEIAKIAVFPAGWESRWSESHSIDDVKRLFKVEEVLFAFVSDIQIHVHSDSLARLGCSLTDCPGLFASQFDTQVAINAMTRANAVIYLLGNKAIGEEDKKSIKEVMKHKALRDKVFFALNQKEKNIVTEGVVKADKAAIKDMGYGDVEITNFNSLLFFLSEFGKAKLSGKIDEYSLHRFKEVAVNNGYETEDIDDLWAEITRTCGLITGQKEAGKIVCLDNEGVCVTRTASCCDNVIGGIENNIVSQKAQSILVDSGATPIKDSLDGIAARLQSEEELAKKSVEEREMAFEEALRAYNEFKSDVEEILDNAFPHEIIESISQSAYTELITNNDVIDRVSKRISDDVDATLGFWGKASLIAKSKEEKSRIFTPIIKNALDIELGGDLNVWSDSMAKGEHNLCKNMILPLLEAVSMKINYNWELNVGKNPILDGYKIITPPIACPSDFITKDDIGEEVGDKYNECAYDEIVTVFVYAIGGAIIGGIVTWLTGVGIFILIYAIIAGWAGSDSSSTYKKISESLKELFNDEKTKNEVLETLAKCPKTIINSFKSYYRKQLSVKQQGLEADIEQKRRDQAESQEHLKEVAERAHSIRTEQIEPLSSKVDEFLKSLKS